MTLQRKFRASYSEGKRKINFSSKRLRPFTFHSLNPTKKRKRHKLEGRQTKGKELPSGIFPAFSTSPNPVSSDSNQVPFATIHPPVHSNLSPPPYSSFCSSTTQSDTKAFDLPLHPLPTRPSSCYFTGFYPKFSRSNHIHIQVHTTPHHVRTQVGP